MPKSALPAGTTPHRRKKAPTKKSSVEDDGEYCFGDVGDKTEGAKTTSKHSKARWKSGGSDAKITSKKSSSNDAPKSSRGSSRTEKENALNGSSKSQKHDISVDELNKSMADVSISSSSQNRKSSSREKLHKIREIELPKHLFPPIRSESVSPSLSESIKSLKGIDTKSLPPSLIETIQKSSLKPSVSMSLEENCSSIKLVMKQCLKSPTLNSLQVAVHCLRSILGVVDKGTGIKLAFHSCVLAGEGTMKSLDTKKDKEVGEYALLTLVAYQVLGRLVRGNKFTWDDELLVEGKKELLPKRQMVKICLDCGIAASSAFMHLTFLSMRGVSIKNEFGLDLSGDFHSILANTAPLLVEMDEEGSKFAKRMFRFLLDGTRCVDDIRIGLHLQCLAVALLAQYCVETVPNADRDQLKEIQLLWDKAASSALKAVAAFDKQATTKEMQTVLLDFHNVAGGMLDNTWVQFNCHTEKQLGPSSYFEYCVYKSLHQWKFLGYVDCVHRPDELLRENGCKYTSSDVESLSAMACFSVVLLALESRVALTNKESFSYSNTSCNAVIANFDTVTCSASYPSQMRCRSMLQVLSFQKDATKMIASCRSDCNGQGCGLATLGYVLGRCMAPLETRISCSIEDKQKSLSLCLSASDNHAKAASFLDLSVQDTSASDEMRKRHNTECLRQVRKGFELLAVTIDKSDDLESGSTAVLAVEMFAKVNEVFLFEFHVLFTL